MTIVLGNVTVPDGLPEVLEELGRARDKFPQFNSAHEGLAVLYAEYLELQTEVFWGTSESQRSEVIQVAAMALRFLDDVIDNPLGSEQPDD